MLAWLLPLAATVLVQATASFLSRLIPALAPVLTLQAGLSPATVGYLAAFNTLGSIAFLIMGAPLIRRAGPVRALQIGLIISGLGTLLLLGPTALTLVLSAFLTGVGYGPTPSAGSEVLQRYAPPSRRALIFSIKQAGVPVGGALAGLTLPLFSDSDWRLAILASSALVLFTILAVQPARASVDSERQRDLALSWRVFLSWSNLSAPIRALGASRELPLLTAASICFACAQGVLFAFFVTTLVIDGGMSLALAGTLFAIMQAAGIVGRVAMGWLADKTGSARLILCLAIASAMTMATLGLSSPAWPVWLVGLIAGVSGITVASWNGVFLSEVARLAPREKIAEATAGSTLLTFIGYIVGPSAVAILAQATGSYRAGYGAVALIMLASLAFLIPLARRSRGA